jgi:hypothetical protein
MSGLVDFDYIQNSDNEHETGIELKVLLGWTDMVTREKASLQRN